MRQLVPSLLVLALVAGNASAVATATVTKRIGIVAKGDQSTIAYDVNASGQVAAVLEDDDGRQRGILYENGKVTELGTLGGDFSDVKKINPSGEIIGSAQNREGHWRAFIYDSKNGMRDLGTLGGPSSFGMAINMAGHAAGFADNADGNYRAFLSTRAGEMVDLGTLGGKISYAAGMNNNGQVVGTAATADEYRHAFLYDAARGMVDLGTLGGRQSSATAINDDGIVVGTSETKGRRWHAFVFDGKKMVDLGALIGRGSSFATGINKAGHVVGTVVIGDERQTFVWRDGIMIVHRGGKGLNLTNAINDREVVIGATWAHRYEAATMASNAIPVSDHGGMKFMFFAVLAVLTGAAAVVFRRRYRGLVLGTPA
jgi:probable HAF family extracellular repeat protein